MAAPRNTRAESSKRRPQAAPPPVDDFMEMDVPFTEDDPFPLTEPTAASNLAGLTREVESLVQLMTSTDVSELRLESGSLKIVIRRGGQTTGAQAHNHAPPAAPLPVLAPVTPPPAAAPAHHPLVLPGVGHGHSAAPVLGPGEHLITSPMVGTFYAAPAPNEKPYVLEGDEVSSGQTVGIVEAMKMMNPIEAESSGRVKKILVRDTQGVEYGQPLMIIGE